MFHGVVLLLNVSKSPVPDELHPEFYMKLGLK